jgi:carbonic anhydrase
MNRRTDWSHAPGALAPLLALLVVGGAFGCAGAQKPLVSATLTQSEQQAMAPADVVALLKAGNDRFVRGELTARDYLAQAKATAGGQYPMAVVLSCLDSRIPVELVFDRGIGDLFVARVAGNFENTDIVGSMEFATKLAGAKLIVVLGHTSCGAVKGACDGAEMGNLTSTLANIAPAVEASKGVEGEHNSKNKAFVAAVTHANVKQTMADLTARSTVIKELVEAGKLAIVGGTYDLETGAVEWLSN